MSNFAHVSKRFWAGLLSLSLLVALTFAVTPVVAQEGASRSAAPSSNSTISIVSAQACYNDNTVHATAYIDTGDTPGYEDAYWVFGIVDVADVINSLVATMTSPYGPSDMPLPIAFFYDYDVDAFDGGGQLSLSGSFPIEPGQDIFVFVYMEGYDVFILNVQTVTGQLCGGDAAAQLWRDTTCGVNVSAAGGPTQSGGMWLVGGLLTKTLGEIEEIGYWRDDAYLVLGWQGDGKIATADNGILTDEQLALLLAMCGW
jgi:hypothetical protein